MLAAEFAGLVKIALEVGERAEESESKKWTST
jgi:hypothetical protein